MYQVNVCHGFRISKLSEFGSREAEVLLPPLAQFEVIAVQKWCEPVREDDRGQTWAIGRNYPMDYTRVVGPDIVQLKQLR